MTNKKLVFAGIISFATIAGCTYKKATNCVPSNTVTYTNAIATIMSDNCTSCHKAGNANAGLKFDSYANMLTDAKDKLNFMGSINHINSYTAMPQGAAKLDDSTIAKIQSWVNGCMPE
ncbi:MAG: cytochrome c [Chitinophagaceae bacterium]|nr:cytochrome c [Chitinophagaceae bacterium]